MTHDATVMMPTDRSTRPRHAHVSSADARDTWAAWRRGSVPSSRPDVAIVGLGYVGLPTALSLVERGYPVWGLDTSVARLGRIQAGTVDLLEDDHRRLSESLSGGRLRLGNDPGMVGAADVVVICVPTPIDEHRLPDLSMLRGACASVVEQAREGQLIILTSTTYAGTTRDLLVEPLQARGLVVGEDVFVAFSPERVDPGIAAHAQHQVPRVVGGVTPACSERAARLLGDVASNIHVVSSPEAAELTKLFENTFRAVNISLANEFASACAELGADVGEILDAAATKPYGFMKFTPGPGVGGHCIPCDPHYLLWQLRKHRVRMPTVESAMASIDARPLEVVERVRELLAEQGVAPSRARVLVVGATYKPDVEDVRESPALEIMTRLMSLGIDVSLADVMVKKVALDNGITVVSEPLAQLDPAGYDVVLLHTRHAREDLGALSQARVVLDATYSADPQTLPGRVTL